MYGRKDLTETMGVSLTISSDGRPEFPTGGITLDWDAIPVAGVTTVWPQTVTLLAGKKGFRYGTLICRIITDDDGFKVGYFAPYDATATDGRQLVTRGDCFLALSSWLQEIEGIGVDADHPPVIQGGEVFRARLLMGGAGQPTLNAILAAFPRLTFAQD